MRLIEVDVLFDDDGNHVGFKTEDGIRVTEFDGVDHKDNPVDVLTKLTNMLKDGDELVEMADGSDTLWYGILRA